MAATDSHPAYTAPTEKMQAPVLAKEEGNAQKTEAPPSVLSKLLTKQNVPIILAFLSGWHDVICFKQYKSYALMPTGNTVNLFMQIGNRDYSNVKFLLSCILNYCAGMGIYKYLDLKGLTNKSAASLVLALHAVGDQLRLFFPQSRFTNVPLSLFGGFYNALSAGKLGGINAMQNGQYNGLMVATAQMAAKGKSDEQRANFLKSLRIVLAFAFGLSFGAYAGNMNHPFTQLTKRRFSVMGAIYAAILMLGPKF
jgi:uncharacterized membrane protein YoaK (UPF0700 family)